jgi:hypothetical protein
MMSTKVTGIVRMVFQYGIAIIGAFFFIMILSGNDENGSFISRAISLSLWSIYIGAGIAVLFGIYQFAINLKHNKKGLIGIVAFVVIIFIANMMAKNQVVTDEFLESGTVTTQDLIMTDTGLYTFYALIIIAILAIIFSEVSRIFK